MLSTLPILAVAQGPSFGIPAVVLLAWLPIAFVIMRALPAGRGLIAAYLVGWLFLPQSGIETPFVVYDKAVAVSLGVLLGAMISHPLPLLAWRPRWIDWPMALWCAVGMFSALSNGLNFYDGAASSARQIFVWGIPYFLGRAYLTRWVDAVDLAKGIFIAGLVYAPFCLAEVRLSPFWHYLIYRMWQHDEFGQTFREGGWRPMVFMQHGLAVGMFMTAASLMGFWLWWTGLLKQFARLPVIIPLLCLLATTVLVKSMGALVLLPIGAFALGLTRTIKTRLLLLAIMVVPTVYVLARTAGGWTGDSLVNYALQTFGPDRAQSLQYRFDNENAYVAHDAAQPLLGYGPGYTFMVFFNGKPMVVDSLWIITLSVNGAIGLLALIAMFSVPIAGVMWRIPLKHYAHPAFAAAIGLAVLLLLYALDNLVNAMFNPVFVLAMGCLAALAKAPIAAPLPKAVLQSRRIRPKAAAAAAPATPAWAANPVIDAEVIASETIPLESKS